VKIIVVVSNVPVHEFDKRPHLNNSQKTRHQEHHTNNGDGNAADAENALLALVGAQERYDSFVSLTTDEYGHRNYDDDHR
jgi:hypothetical protein